MDHYGIVAVLSSKSDVKSPEAWTSATNLQQAILAAEAGLYSNVLRQQTYVCMLHMYACVWTFSKLTLHYIYTISNYSRNSCSNEYVSTPLWDILSHSLNLIVFKMFDCYSLSLMSYTYTSVYSHIVSVFTHKGGHTCFKEW